MAPRFPTRSSIVPFFAFLVASAGVPAFAAAADPCTQAAMSAILSSYSTELKFDIKCPLAQLSDDDPACFYQSTLPGPQIKSQIALEDAIDGACVFPQTAETACAYAAASQSIDVVRGTLNLRSPPLEPDGRKRACRKAIALGSAKLARATAKLQKTCNTKALAGDANFGPAGPLCNDSQGNTQTSIAEAEEKLRDSIASRCGGADRMIGGGDDLDPQDDLAFPADCPGGAACAASIPEIGELTECAICIAAKSVDKAVAGAMALPLASVAECKVVVIEAYNDLARTSFARRTDCETDVLSDSESPACPTEAVAAALAADEVSAASEVAANCGSLDPQDDLGFAASCPDVASCAAIDVGSLAGMSNCLACVTAARVSLVVSNVFPTADFQPDAIRRHCHDAIARNISRRLTGFSYRKLSWLESCQRQVACGQTTSVCPSDWTSALVESGRARTREVIERECVEDVLEEEGIPPDPQDLGYETTCPDLYACGGQETDTLGGLVTCLTCISDAAVDELSDLYTPGP